MGTSPRINPICHHAEDKLAPLVLVHLGVREKEVTNSWPYAPCRGAQTPLSDGPYLLISNPIPCPVIRSHSTEHGPSSAEFSPLIKETSLCCLTNKKTLQVSLRSQTEDALTPVFICSSFQWTAFLLNSLFTVRVLLVLLLVLSSRVLSNSQRGCGMKTALVISLHVCVHPHYLWAALGCLHSL